MTKIKAIVKECIDGCTANNVKEECMHYNINYYVNNATGSGTKHYCFVYKIKDLEENLYNIIRDNISKDHDVVITDITIKFNDSIIRVNKNNYAYSLSNFMAWIASEI
jgi:hypothetical protein